MKPKIKPPRGYRIMRPMERPDHRKGDMFLCACVFCTIGRSGLWHPEDGYAGEKTVKEIIGKHYVLRYARKIK